MFGRHPRIAVDIAMGRGQQAETGGRDYVSNLRNTLQEAYELAESHTRSSQGYQKDWYDHKAQGAVLEKGDRVLILQVGLKGMHKLANKWSENVYIVVDQPNMDIPVYKVKPESMKGKHKVLHRNLLLSISFLPVKYQKLRQGCETSS